MDQFDKYIKSQLQNAEVPFNESHWNEFNRHLKAQTKKSKTLKTISAAAIIILAIGIASYLLFNDTPEKSKSLSTLSETKQVIKDNIRTTKQKVEKQNHHSEVTVANNKKTTTLPTDSKATTNSPVQDKTITPHLDKNDNEPNNVVSDKEKEDDIAENNNAETPIQLITSADSTNQHFDINSLSIQVSQNEVCTNSPIDVTLKNPNNYDLDIEWFFGDGHSEKGEFSTHVYKFAGEYKILCKVNDNFEHQTYTISYDKPIIVKSLPKAEINYKNMWEDYDNNKLYYPYTDLTVQTTDKLIAYHWNISSVGAFNTKQAQVILKEQKSYIAKLIITNANGCSTTITTQIENPIPFDILAPNAFTPNNDGKNDTFYPEAVKVHSVPASIIIKDVSGKTVFEGTQDNCEWNGTLMNQGQPLPEGVYIYTVVTTDILGQQHQFVGKVNLLR